MTWNILTLIKATRFIKRQGNDRERVVLYSRPLPPLDDQERFEYITWRETREGARYWGHYFRDLNKALTDFEKRNISLFQETEA